MPNDLRPPKDWWQKCVGKTGSAALCGWVFYHWLKARKPKDKEEPDEPETRHARARKRAWLRKRSEDLTTSTASGAYTTALAKIVGVMLCKKPKRDGEKLWMILKKSSILR